jgi:hypothetical protein
LGAVWAFTRTNGLWTQLGGKLVGTNAVGPVVIEGTSVSLSGDGDALIAGGFDDNAASGAAWVFVQPLEVSPYGGAAFVGKEGGPFSPAAFQDELRATGGTVGYSIAGVPSWLTASLTSGTVTTTGKTITFTINKTAGALRSGVYHATLEFNNTDGKQASMLRAVTLTVNP